MLNIMQFFENKKSDPPPFHSQNWNHVKNPRAEALMCPWSSDIKATQREQAEKTGTDYFQICSQIILV